MNNSALGIISSLFLKKLNSIVKSFASALELIFTALLCSPILGIHINHFYYIPGGPNKSL